jgi:hypothetical protein
MLGDGRSRQDAMVGPNHPLAVGMGLRFWVDIKCALVWHALKGGRDLAQLPPENLVHVGCRGRAHNQHLLAVLGQ